MLFPVGGARLAATLLDRLAAVFTRAPGAGVPLAQCQRHASCFALPLCHTHAPTIVHTAGTPGFVAAALAAALPQEFREDMQEQYPGAVQLMLLRARLRRPQLACAHCTRSSAGPSSVPDSRACSTSEAPASNLWRPSLFRLPCNLSACLPRLSFNTVPQSASLSAPARLPLPAQASGPRCRRRRVLTAPSSSTCSPGGASTAATTRRW